MARPKEASKAKGRLIPEGELPCIWMDAGLISYKLCGYEYECENCPFDAEMKKSGPSREGSALEQQSQEDGAKRHPLGRKPAGRFLPEISATYLYHPGHTWAEPGGEPKAPWEIARIGVDSFAAKVLPPVKDVILPNKGSSIHQGQVFCWLVCGSSTLPMVAPLGGTVVSTNHRLTVQPTLIKTDPYGEGWFLWVDPSEPERELGRLMKGKVACAWMGNEQKKFERLASLLGWPSVPLSMHGNEIDVGVTLADGGEWVGGLTEVVSSRRYFEFVIRFFL